MLKNELLTTGEAAKILGRERRTLARWIRRNEVPGLGLVIGGRVYVRRHVLEALLNGDLEAGQPQPASVA